MAITYSIANQKGGAAKTTTALCIVEQLQNRGYKTLVIDLDQQLNATKQYKATYEGQTTVFDLLTTETATRDFDPKEAIQVTERGDIIAGDPLMVGAEVKMSGMAARETILDDALETIKADYDFIIIDCPPSLGLVTQNALVTSDRVIVPVEAERFATEGVGGIADTIHSIQANKRLNPGLVWDGILLTRLDTRERRSKEYIEQMPAVAKSLGTKGYKTYIRRCVKVGNAQQYQIPLIEYAPDCTTTQDYEALVTELLKEVK